MVLISPGQRLLLRLSASIFLQTLQLLRPGNGRWAGTDPQSPCTEPPLRLTSLRSSLRHTFLHFSRLPHFLVFDALRRQEVSAHSSTAAVRQRRDVIAYRKCHLTTSERLIKVSTQVWTGGPLQLTAFLTHTSSDKLCTCGNSDTICFIL